MSLDENQTSSCEHSCKLEPSENNAELGDQITLLAAQINAATYQFLKFVAEFDRRGGWSGAGRHSFLFALAELEMWVSRYKS